MILRKPILILLSVVAIMGGTMALSHSKNKNKSKSGTLRAAFPYAKSASEYEPSRIYLAPEYIFLENIYSPLVEVSPKTGEIEPGVAQSYRWVGTDLHLLIRDNLKTISGKIITAKDAEFSLKRLLAMPGNTHGDFRELICGNTNLTSIEDQCQGIHVEKNELILTTTESGKTFLLTMLAAIDFAIIPKSAVDSKSMKIINYAETSGPYYVYQDSPKGEIELRANPNHYHYSAQIPQAIVLVPSSSSIPHGSLEDFKSGRVDYITTVDAARADDVIAFSRTVSDSVLHTSMNIRSFVVMFSPRGLKELSSEERFAIGEKLRESISKSFAGTNGYENSRQFFPAFGEGALDKEKMAVVEKKFQSAKSIPEKPLSMTLVRLGDPSKFVAAIKAALPQIETTVAENSTSFQKYKSINDMPHMVLVGPDTGFLEDIGLISYSMNAGYFGLNADERKLWLKKYMDLQDKSHRLELLRALHEKALSEPIIVPLLSAPYAALARKPWKIGLSQLYANNQLWLIQTN